MKLRILEASNRTVVLPVHHGWSNRFRPTIRSSKQEEGVSPGNKAGSCTSDPVSTRLDQRPSKER
jgi:hypothetical protein